MKKWPALVGAAVLALGASMARSGGAQSEIPMPAPTREFRGVWVATVANIDWPSRPGLSTEQQQAEMRALLDRAVKLNLNAVVFQVRPACDALYQSDLEPWSEVLTGRMGQAPQPFYDPLKMWIDESHRRGLELHAWFNPYRARQTTNRATAAPNHVSRARPELVKTYGKQLWMDPADKDVQEYSLDVIRDVVKRYDVDGIHIDDYFYPYKEKSGSRTIPFPDDASWARYKTSGGKLTRDDWRRAGVDAFVKKLYETVKREKKWVKFGISPFGIWRPGYPASVKGLDQYSELYADARKWLQEGWVDYYTPQLYWKISAPNQSYPALLRWWIEQNHKARHIWPGNYTSQVTMGKWPASELTEQIRVTREHSGASGNVHFSAKALQQSSDLNVGLSRMYAQRSLIPASPWLDDRAPREPSLNFPKVVIAPKRLAWSPAAPEQPFLWVVRLRSRGQWAWDIRPGHERFVTRVGAIDVKDADLAVVTAVDRVGNESKPATLNLREVAGG